MVNGRIIPIGGNVIYKDFVWDNVAITTRDGTSSIYYTGGQTSKLSISMDGYTPIAATIQDWSGASAPIFFYIAGKSILGAFSNASQTPTKIYVRVAYVKDA